MQEKQIDACRTIGVSQRNGPVNRVGYSVAQRSKLQLSKINHKTSSKDMWTVVQQVIPTADGITAEALNQHYAGISSDQNYWPPQKRHTVALSQYEPVYEWQVFLPATATGLDQLPVWFLRTGALFFYRPITRLFNASIATSTIPHHWKQAKIRPVAKTTNPLQNSDYHPISVTSVLSRVVKIARFLRSINRH